MFRKSTRRRHTITDASSTQRNDQRPSCVSLQIQHGNFRKVDMCADDIISCAITGNSKMTMNIHKCLGVLPSVQNTSRPHDMGCYTIPSGTRTPSLQNKRFNGAVFDTNVQIVVRAATGNVQRRQCQVERDVMQCSKLDQGSI
jgi:hypothetical protein